MSNELEFFAETTEQGPKEIDYVKEAARRNTSVIKVMSEFDATGNSLRNPKNWGPVDFDFLSSSFRKYDVDLIGDDSSLLAELSADVSKKVQFPESTTYFHGLSIVCAAMCQNFTYEFKGDKYPCNIYGVSSQPPGSGKSPMHRHFFEPYATALKEYNEDQKKERGKLKKQMSVKQEQIKAAKNNKNEMISLITELEELEHEHKALIDINVKTNSTAAAADDLAAKQGGLFSIISDEAEALSVLVGNTYSSGDQNQDFEIFLKGWDGGYFSSGRISREGYTGYVRGSIVVCAQDSVVSQLIKTAETGRGVFDRVLIFLEPDIMGHRNHSEAALCETVRSNLETDWLSMMREIVRTKNKSFKFNDDAKRQLASIRDSFEPYTRRGEIYGSDIWRGTVSKAGAQICKIACGMYAIDHVRFRKGYNMEIGKEYIIKAAVFYKKVLDQMYCQVNQHTGADGDQEVRAVYEWLLTQKKKQKVNSLFSVDFKQLYDKIRNRKCFASIKQDKKEYIKNTVMPRAEAANILVLTRDIVHVNPNLQPLENSNES